MQLLEQRYPDISFLLSFFPYPKVRLANDCKELILWLETQPLEEIEVLYIVGLFNSALPIEMQTWLQEKKERVLIFLEKDLGAFAAFTQDELFVNPQIHFHLAQDGFHNDYIEELSQAFPTDRLAIFVPRNKKFDVLQLQRRSAALSALYSDVLYSHFIAENVLAHFRQLSLCFAANHWKDAFKGIPAIICGAGPSLEKNFSALQNAQHKALVFAGGTAISACTKQGIQPHFAIALDPNEEEFLRLKQASFFEGPFLFAPRLHRHIFATANGPYGYMKTDTGGMIENWLEKTLELQDPPIGPDMGSEAFSVTTLAISYAYALGCNPIILVGVDLSYKQGERYTKGIEASPESFTGALDKKLIRQDIHGETVETLLKWVMEADAISTFAKTHGETLFLNATQGGLPLAMDNIHLEEFLSSQKNLDLQGMIHSHIQETLLNKEFSPPLESLSLSLIRSRDLCAKILQQLSLSATSGRVVLYQSDLRQEEAYSCFLMAIEGALDHLLPRYFPNLDLEQGKKEREIAKYREMGVQIERFIEVVQRQLSHRAQKVP